jgi:hypothetical protein
MLHMRHSFTSIQAYVTIADFDNPVLTFWFICSQNLHQLFGFPSFRHWTYLLKVSPATYLIKVSPATYLIKVSPVTYLIKVSPATYLIKVSPATYRAHYIWYLRFYYAVDRIGGVLVSVRVSIAVDRVFDLRSGHTKNYKTVTSQEIT